MRPRDAEGSKAGAGLCASLPALGISRGAEVVAASLPPLPSPPLALALVGLLGWRAVGGGGACWGLASPEPAGIAAWGRSKSEAGAVQVIEIGFCQPGAGLFVEGRIIYCLTGRRASPAAPRPSAGASPGLGLLQGLLVLVQGCRGALYQAVRGSAGAAADAGGVCFAVLSALPPPATPAQLCQRPAGPRLGSSRASITLTV